MKKNNNVQIKLYDETLKKNHPDYRELLEKEALINGIIYEVFYDGRYIASFRIGYVTYHFNNVEMIGVYNSLEDSLEKVLDIAKEYDREYSRESKLQYDAYLKLIKIYADINQYDKLKEKYIKMVGKKIKDV